MNYMQLAKYLAEFQTLAALLPAEVRGPLEAIVKQKLREAADDALDFVEDYVDKTDTPWDDMIVEPLVHELRTRFGIPDDIGGDED